jgi:hypothetical protein
MKPPSSPPPPELCRKRGPPYLDIELQGLKNYHTKDFLLSILAHLCDDNQAQLREFEKTNYAATDEAWKEYEYIDTTHSPAQWPTLVPSPGKYLACLRIARRLQASPT